MKHDIFCLDHNQCLLTGTNTFKKATLPREANKEGAYLWYKDMNNIVWIRSGKAVGSTFGARHGGHKNGSLLANASSLRSKFYTHYPSKCVSLPDKGGQLGYFENLQQFVAIGYDKLRKGNLLVDVKNGGIFHLNAEINKKIEAVNFKGCNRLQTKQLHMLGYLWEISYDLCIAPAANISGNPGFEVLLGVN